MQWVKLDHPLEEVRQRSLRSLRSKLEVGLLHPRDLALDQTVLRSLLGLLAKPERAGAVEVLQLLVSEPSAVRLLVGLGAVEKLQRLRVATAGNEQLTAAAAKLADRLTHLPSHGASGPDIPGLLVVAEQRTPPREALPKLPPAPSARSPASSRSLVFDTAAPGATFRVAKREPAGARAKRGRIAASSLPAPSWAMLRAQPPSRADEQALFETAVRLQMSEAAALRETCRFFGGELAHDVSAGKPAAIGPLAHSAWLALPLRGRLPLITLRWNSRVAKRHPPLPAPSLPRTLSLTHSLHSFTAPSYIAWGGLQRGLGCIVGWAALWGGRDGAPFHEQRLDTGRCAHAAWAAVLTPPVCLALRSLPAAAHRSAQRAHRAAADFGARGSQRALLLRPRYPQRAGPRHEHRDS